MMKQEKYYTNLDIIKWICSLIVVAIHVSPLEEIAPTINIFFKDVVARVAVMLFFAISGLVFFSKLIFHNGKITNCPQNKRNLLRYLGSILVLYTGWSIVYFLFQLPSWKQTGWWGWTLVKDSIVAFFAQGLYYHMWFLLALLYGVPVLYALMMVFSEKQMNILTVLLCLSECALSSYSWLGCGEWVEHIPYYFLLDCPIHAVTRTVPLLYIGYTVHNRVKVGSSKKYIRAAVFLSISLLIEAVVMYVTGVNQNSFGFMLSTPILVFSIIMIAMSIPQFSNGTLARRLRKSSVVIYCIHPLILSLCRTTFVVSQCVYWLLCTSISLGIGYVYALTLEMGNRTINAK